jgi:hypothetical protein
MHYVAVILTMYSVSPCGSLSLLVQLVEITMGLTR